jgi:hypothetical protein
MALQSSFLYYLWLTKRVQTLFVRNFVSWCGLSSPEELGSFLYVEDVVCLLIWQLKWLWGLSRTFCLKLIAEALSDLVACTQSKWDPALLLLSCFIMLIEGLHMVSYMHQKVWYKETSKFFSMWLEWGYAIKEFNIMVVSKWVVPLWC